MVWFYYSSVLVCQVFSSTCWTSTLSLSLSLSLSLKSLTLSRGVERLTVKPRESACFVLTSLSLQALASLRHLHFGACGMYSCNSALTSATCTGCRPSVLRASSSPSTTGAACTCMLASSLPTTCTRLRRTTLVALQFPCGRDACWCERCYLPVWLQKLFAEDKFW